MMLMKRTLLAFTLALLCGAPVAADEALIDKGLGVYKQFCLKCHGIDMVNSGVSSYDLRKYPTDRYDDFVDTLKNGKGNMPAWGDILYPEEIEQVWAYVSSRGGKEPFPPKKTEASPAKKALNTITKGTLTACLPQNGGAMAGRRSAGGIGLDYEMAAAVAEAAELELEVIWFEGELEEESDPTRDTYAMLSYPLCDIVPGHLLYDGTFGPRDGQRSGLPRWLGKPDTFHKGFAVDLQPVNVSFPYARIEMGIVVAPDVERRNFSGLADLEGLVVGIQEDTLAGALTLTQGGQAVKDKAVTANPGPVFLWDMERGSFEAALVSTPAYDFHLRQNSLTKLVLTEYRHPIGFNIGFAALTENSDLIAVLNEVITDLRAVGGVAKLAAKSNLHYAPPQEPYVQSRITVSDLHMRR